MSVTKVGRIVSFDWQSSAEGETILQHFYDPQTTGRKVTEQYEYVMLHGPIEHYSVAEHSISEIAPALNGEKAEDFEFTSEQGGYIAPHSSAASGGVTENNTTEIVSPLSGDNAENSVAVKPNSSNEPGTIYNNAYSSEEESINNRCDKDYVPEKDSSSSNEELESTNGEMVIQNGQTVGRRDQDVAEGGDWQPKRRNLNKGILDRPSLPSSIEEVSYKIHITGRSGIGKTSTVTRLSGIKCNSSYTETAGIRKSNILWPVKIWDKIILFKLQLWDAGDNCIKKYSHILPACREKADAMIFVFSFLDINSFTELSQHISKVLQTGENPAVIAIGTRYSHASKLHVSALDIKEFELKWQVPVLKIDNTWSGNKNDSEVHEVAPLLNMICELLWIRDQEYLLKQGLVR